MLGLGGEGGALRLMCKLTLQHTAKNCKALQLTANKLQRTATHYNVLQHTDAVSRR